MPAAIRHLFTAAFLLALAPLAGAVPPGSVDDIAARIAPIGSVCVAGDDCGDGAAAPAGAAAADLSGEEVYNTYCSACHAIGVAGAPVFGDSAAWAPRVAKGKDALYASTINGFGAMPAGGTCGACSEDDLKEAVDHMVSAAE